MFSIDFRATLPKVWRATELNDAAIALYGKDKFATITKSKYVELIVPHITIVDASQIPITINSSLKAKSLALFQDKEPFSLIAVFDTHGKDIISYEINIRKEIKGTLFAVVETEDGKLYYARAFLDVLCIPCMRAKQ